MNLELVNPMLWAVPCFIALILLELAYSKTHDNEDLYSYKELLASSSMGLGAVIISVLIKFISAAVIFYFIFEIFNPEVGGVRTNIFGYESFGWAWYTWLICQFLDDFCYYWLHRFNHTVRFMWAAHIVHHSSNSYNLGTGLRNGWFTLIYKPLFYMWLPAIGFHPEMVLICLAIESIWQFQLHTKYVPNLGFIEKFMNTHRQHQVHHARNVEYLDKNHGGYLNLFDRLFGTWKNYDKNINIEYGVVSDPKSHNPLVLVSHEYKAIWQDLKKANSFYEGFMYIFGEPGWSPDGSTLTVKQQQKNFSAEKTTDTISKEFKPSKSIEENVKKMAS
jgi:sterol desaturase/sphingolipid hydroxylase (fatty acid hydroxylase superfamily)